MPEDGRTAPRRLRRKGRRRGRRPLESLVPGSDENHEITYGDSGQREVGGEDSRRRRPAGTRLILIDPQLVFEVQRSPVQIAGYNMGNANGRHDVRYYI